MNTEDLKHIRTWFDGYVNNLFGEKESHPACINLKVEHTQRVAENAHQIAEETGWNPGDILTGEALGWLHDVGRFAQFSEYGHFHDATSVNHGECGSGIVQEADILSSLSEGTRHCLLEGIRHHNARTIPVKISEDCLPYLKLIRDADKLDIYRVVLEHLQKDGFQELKNMWPHVDLRGPVSPKVLESAQKEKNGATADIQSLADFLLLQISWVYELHYAPTLKSIAQQGILDDLAAYLPDEEGPREIVRQAKDFVSTSLPFSGKKITFF